MRQTLKDTLPIDPRAQAQLLALAAQVTTRREIFVASKPSLATVPPPRSSRGAA